MGIFPRLQPVKPFFNHPEKIARLQVHALAWLGTPFMPNAAIKGRGVSCQMLAGAIYRELGVLPAGYEIATGPMDWSHAQTESRLAQAVADLPQFASVPWPARPGDLLGIQLGGCIHHCGVVLGVDGKFIHCLRGAGVVLSSVRDASYLKRIKKIWRPVLADAAPARNP